MRLGNPSLVPRPRLVLRQYRLGAGNEATCMSRCCHAPSQNMGNTPAGVDSASVSSDEDEQGGKLSSSNMLEQLAKRYQVSQAEVQLLYERFQKLGPDGDGRLNRSVFQKPPYSTDPFSRQIWKRMSGETGAPNKITFPSFVRTMVWWQQAPMRFKLELMFSWMKDVDGITPELLARILSHVFPEYQQDELKQMAEQIVTMMSQSTTADSGSRSIKLEDFLNWCSKIPEDKLKKALDFKILHVDAGR